MGETAEATNALPVIDYSRKDFQSVKEALLDLLKQRFPNTWRDFYESQMGMAWLELICFAFDNLGFYLDYQANESYLPTAQDRENVVKLLKLVGYNLRGATAASVQCLLTLGAAELDDVIIPAGTALNSTSGLVFEFLTEARIAAGSLTGEAVITEGQTKNEVFLSDGTKYQRFTLSNKPIINDSVVVTVNGVEWEIVDSVVYGDSTSQVCAVSFDVDVDGVDVAIVEFGDGVSGAIPPNGATINVTARVGGGVAGNVALNNINEQVQGQLDGVLPVTPVQVAVTNPTYRGTGGEERESIEHAKYWGPQWVRTNGRAVTENDFDTLASLFSDPTYGAVAYAKAKLRQEIPELNTVDLYVWSRDSQGNPVPASASLKAALQAYFDNDGAGSVRIICVDTEVQDGVNLYLDISIRAMPEARTASTDMIANIREAVEALFDSSLVLPGEDFRISHLYHAIQDAAGVDYAIIEEIAAGVQYILSLGAGDDATKDYSGTLTKLPVLPSTVTITAGDQSVADDGLGTLVGDGSGTIDYDTGALSVTFDQNVPSGASVVASYRQLQQFQRGEQEAIGDGNTARYRRNVKYPPVVPGSFALASGDMVVVDDGDGNLIGDVYTDGKNTIDYDTGAYDVQFASPPGNQVAISSTYRQYLQVNAGDIPVEKDQLAVLGNLTIQSMES